MSKPFLLVSILCLVSAAPIKGRCDSGLETVLAALYKHSGAKLVFQRSELPPGDYYELMVPLSEPRRLAAAQIANREVQKYPRGYLGAIGIKRVGIFASCASTTDDGYRTYDKELKGYPYYGMFNGRDAVVAAYYSDHQLPLTLHHEIFHQVDAVFGRLPNANAAGGDEAVYFGAPGVTAANLTALGRVASGDVLTDYVSSYAHKNPSEDRAETARYFMSHLADSLLQCVRQPELRGSQRILSIIHRYGNSLNGSGPDVDWFVSVALARNGTIEDAHESETVARRIQDVTAKLRELSQQTPVNDDALRRQLSVAETLANQNPDASEIQKLVHASLQATGVLLRSRLQPAEDDKRFAIRGHEDADGVNWTLRDDIATLGRDQQRLARIAAALPEKPDWVMKGQMQNLRLITRFYCYILARWDVTPGTREVFEQACIQFAKAIPTENAGVRSTIESLDLTCLATGITSEGLLVWRMNPYLANVDSEIRNAAVKIAIRRVQPACVRLGSGSGVNLAPSGRILTAAHVAGDINHRETVRFPDGRTFVATCTAVDADLDLAIYDIDSGEPLPFARLAERAPVESTLVVCIGQPGELTPTGKPTGYEPFTVSTGAIRGFLAELAGPQPLGRTKHDAWTYWGHSGSPLFDHRGRIVAMHNSWDPDTHMRHAVSYEAIRKFLDEIPRQ